jgi:hypothetical protein
MNAAIVSFFMEQTKDAHTQSSPETPERHQFNVSDIELRKPGVVDCGFIAAVGGPSQAVGVRR